MDNKSINAIAESKQDLDLLVKFVFGNYKKATYYISEKLIIDDSEYDIKKDDKDGIFTLILLDKKPEYDKNIEAQKLPFPLNKDNATDFIYEWIHNIEFPDEPDIDGDCKPGFRIFTNCWGHVPGYSSNGIVLIRPEWAMYGK